MVLKRLFGQRRANPVGFAPPRPDVPVWIVGDVHGSDYLLEDLLARIDAQRAEDDQSHIIFVGDYVDRGEQSAQVLARVMAMDHAYDNVTALMGNHELMMLRFMEDPLEGARWLHYGGLQTLASFGVGGVTESSSQDDLVAAALGLFKAMPKGMESWLKNLALHWSSGNLTVVHAGANPAEPIETQSRRTLTFGHPDFAIKQRPDGQWVAHGHTITDTPGSDGKGRIAVDTGAYYTGQLTAAHVLPTGDVSLLST